MTAPPIRRLLSRGITRTLLTPHPVEHYVRSLGVRWSDDPTGATVTAVDRPVDDVTVLTLRLPAGVARPAPGAALQIGTVIDGVVHRRHYSPVDSASRSDGLATIAVRRHPEGVVSEHLWHHAAPGMRLLLGDPVGEIALPETRPTDVVLVSGGSGITPMMAIASTLADEGHCGTSSDRGGPTGRVAWMHYARRVEDVPFPEQLRELERAGVDVVVVPTTGTSRATISPADTSTTNALTGAPTHALSGHLTADHLDAVAPWHAEATVFLCGPEPLAHGLEQVLGAERFAGVLRERFTASTGSVPDSDGGTVTHLRSGVTARNEGTTLLEGAEAAGLNPTHGCRMGICHTCTAVRVSGTTRDLRTGQVDAEPGCRVQICVNAPVGDVEIEL